MLKRLRRGRKDGSACLRWNEALWKWQIRARYRSRDRHRQDRLSRGFRFRVRSGSDGGGDGGPATRDGDRVAEKRSPLPWCATGIRVRPRVTVAIRHDVCVCAYVCVLSVSARPASSVERPRFACLGENAPAREHFPDERPSHKNEGGGGKNFLSCHDWFTAPLCKYNNRDFRIRGLYDMRLRFYVSPKESLEYLIPTKLSLEFFFFFNRFQTEREFAR